MKDLSNENIIHVKKDGLEFIQFKRLLEFQDKIVHAYTLGLDKNYRRSQAKDNYLHLCKAIGADYDKLVYTNQLHTDRVESLEEVKDFAEDELGVDGLCTNTKRISIATVNADCILLLFYDPVKNVIANVHSGWKGTLQRISIKTVEKMIKEYGCEAKDIICSINPSIRKCHFEVEKDVKDLFEKEFKDISNLDDIIEETTANEKWHIDTVLINRILLKRLGLLEENIIDCNLCSVCNKEQIHSFRVEKEGYGVETAIIGLKE